MAKTIAHSAYAFLFFALLVASPRTEAADRPDFSGSYSLKSANGSKSGEVWTLQVIQTESALNVTKVADGHPNINKFPLDSGDGAYASPGGPIGTCKGQFKGRKMILDMFVTTRPQPNGPAVQMHTRERWELSKDSRTLTIHSDVDFPKFSGLLNGYQVVQPWSEIYIRN